MSNKWNDADKTLLCSAFVFLMALGFHILYPDSIVADGILFVAEAALVGGVADWFAVTALFRKPLGFPFHTAILPNRRQDFIDASVNMVQNEFFSRRSIFKRVSNFHLLPFLIDYLKRKDFRDSIITLIFNEIHSYVKELDKEPTSRKIANEIRRILRDVPSNIIIHELGLWIKKSGKDTEIFVKLIKSLREYVSNPEFCLKIQHILESYVKDHSQTSSAFSTLMTDLAKMLDLVNFSEAASLLHKHLILFLDEIIEDTTLQNNIISHCRTIFSDLAESLDFRDFFYRLQIDSINSLPLDNIINDALNSIERQLNDVNLDKIKSDTHDNKDDQLPALIYNFIAAEYDKIIELLETESTLKDKVEKFTFDLAARSALYARPLFANIASSSLTALSDEQLNSLVYDKAEPDFVWIRLNGSLVGSAIGLVFFIVMHLIS